MQMISRREISFEMRGPFIGAHILRVTTSSSGNKEMLCQNLFRDTTLKLYDSQRTLT